MATHATSTYPPTLEVPHERDGVGDRLQATVQELSLQLAPVARGSLEDHVVERGLEQQQSMLRARLGVHA